MNPNQLNIEIGKINNETVNSTLAVESSPTILPSEEDDRISPGSSGMPLLEDMQYGPTIYLSPTNELTYEEDILNLSASGSDTLDLD